MARIPVRPTGEIAAQVPGRTGIPAGAFAGVGEGLQALGRVGAKIAGAEMAEQRRRDEEALRAKATVDRVRAKAGIDADLADLAEQYRTGIVEGSIDWQGAGAQFDKAALERIEARLQGLDPQDAELVRAYTEGASQRLKQQLGEAARKRTQLDILGSLTAAEELYARNATRDRATAIREYEATLEGVGPQAGLTPAQIAERRQRFRETVAFNDASQLIRNARDDVKALDQVRARINSDEYADLDPTRRGQLEQQVLARQQYLEHQEEVRRRRAEAEAERRLRVAEHSFKALESLVDRGAMPNEQTLAITQAAVAGTPYEGAVGALLQQSRERAGFASLKPSEQQATILALRARANREGTSPAIEQRIARFESIARESEREFAQDPLLWAANRRVIDAVEPLQFNDIGSLLAQLGKRVEQAQVVMAHADKPASPLLQAEADQLARMLAPLPVEQKASAIAQLGAQVRDRGMLAALAKQLDAKDQALGLALLYGTRRTTENRYAGELLLRGQQAIRDGVIKPDGAKETGWKAEIAEMIGDAYQHEELRQRAIDAAFLFRAGLEAAGTGSSIEAAVRMATGGIREQNDGTKIPLPWGWSEDEFEERLGKLTPADIGGLSEVYVGQQAMPVAKFLAQLPDASLVHAGQGKYVVRAGAGFVTDRNGRRVVLDFAR